MGRDHDHRRQSSRGYWPCSLQWISRFTSAPPKFWPCNGRPGTVEGPRFGSGQALSRIRGRRHRPPAPARSGPAERRPTAAESQSGTAPSSRLPRRPDGRPPLGPGPRGVLLRSRETGAPCGRCGRPVGGPGRRVRRTVADAGIDLGLEGGGGMRLAPSGTSSSSVVDSAASADVSPCTLTIGDRSSPAFHRQRLFVLVNEEGPSRPGQVVHPQVLDLTR